MVEVDRPVGETAQKVEPVIAALGGSMVRIVIMYFALDLGPKMFDATLLSISVQKASR
jgi:hypothetical protein